MVPFYGQGMNAGLEDVVVLRDMLQQYPNSLSDALNAYTAHRHVDAVAICDLAMLNYEEMRAHVRSPLYLIRKAIDGLLYRIAPSWFVPRYTMVSFTTTRYSEVIRRSQRQSRWLCISATVLLAALLGVLSIAHLRLSQDGASASSAISGSTASSSAWSDVSVSSLSRITLGDMWRVSTKAATTCGSVANDAGRQGVSLLRRLWGQ